MTNEKEILLELSDDAKLLILGSKKNKFFKKAAILGAFYSAKEDGIEWLHYESLVIRLDKECDFKQFNWKGSVIKSIVSGLQKNKFLKSRPRGGEFGMRRREYSLI